VSEKEINELERTFHRMSSDKTHQQQISLASFSLATAEVLPKRLIEGVFYAFDANHDGSFA
jgi:hypothetical protein